MTLEKGFWTVVTIWLFRWLSVNHCNRFNNYKSGARKVSKVYPNKCNVYQEQFHRHFNSEEHNGIEDQKTITDGTENILELRHRKS